MSFTESELVRCIPTLHKIAARHSSNFAYAEDLVQATLLKALCVREQFVSGKLIAWLTVVMRNEHLMYIRSHHREVVMPDGALIDARMQIAPPQEDAVYLQQVSDYLDTLAVSRRNIFIAVRVLECSYKEAAERTGARIGTVKSSVNRVTERLGTELEPV